MGSPDSDDLTGPLHLPLRHNRLAARSMPNQIGIPFTIKLAEGTANVLTKAWNWTESSARAYNRHQCVLRLRKGTQGQSRC